MFWVLLPLLARHTGLAVVGSPVVNAPLLQFENVAPLTAPAVSRSDSPELTPPVTPVPFPPDTALMLPDAIGWPDPFWQVELLKRAHVTVADATPDVFTFSPCKFRSHEYGWESGFRPVRPS